MYYAYDEEIDAYTCDRDLDEDEMAAFLTRRLKACPFYHPGDYDYYLSGRQ